MERMSVLNQLYAYSDWANAKILERCLKLTDSQLDQPRDLGPGTLRQTLYHVAMAELIWLERWKLLPWRPFPTDAQGMSVADIANLLKDLSQQRLEFFANQTDLESEIAYRNLKGDPFAYPLIELAMHVANHGIHHRSQILAYLKSFGEVFPAGLDYLFFRFAQPVVEQPAETIASMRGFGMEVGTAPGCSIEWDKKRILRYFAYHDWCNDMVLDLASHLSSESLDRDHGMGPGTIRKTLLHLLDAERWWLQNWKDPQPWEHSDPQMTIEALRSQWISLRQHRRTFVESLSESTADRVVEVFVVGMKVRVVVSESLMQLCCHGTHHRAQAINMLRQEGQKAAPSDYVVWLKDNPLA